MTAEVNGNTDVTDKEKKIIVQTEYYFGDINLTRDVFMKNALAENDGWIPMETMLKFNRLKALSEDPAEIIAALAKSSTNLVEISEDKSKLRRNPAEPLPESLQDATSKYADRTIYAKGFASEDTLDDLFKFLEQAGPIVNIHMRRLPVDKKFKGSIFAIFKNKEDAEKFLGMDETKEYKGKAILKEWQSAYNERKKKENAASKAERQKRVEEAQKSREEALLAQMTLGALLKLTGFPKKEKPAEGENANPSGAEAKGQMLKLKEWLLDILGGVAEVAWVDMEEAEGQAVVRFHKENSAALALEKLLTTQPLKFGDIELSAAVITGDEERSRWKATMEEKFKRRGGGRGGGGRGGRGGRGRYGGRGGGGPPNKRQRLDR